MTDAVASERQINATVALRSLLVRTGPAVVGLMVGVAVVWSSPQRGSGTWYPRSALSLALTVSAGAIFSYGLSFWRSLPQTGRPRIIVAGVAAVAALASSANVIYGMTASAGWRAPVLAVSALIGGAPAAAAMSGVRRIAKDVRNSPLPGEQVARLIELRATARRLLAPLGALVALATAGLGAKFQFGIKPVAVPAGEILVFGALGTLLVALFYVPTVAEINRQSTRLCDELFDLRTAADHQAILDLADQRTRLANILGLDRDTFQDLQTGLIVLGPLIASASSILLKP